MLIRGHCRGVCGFCSLCFVGLFFGLGVFELKLEGGGMDRRLAQIGVMDFRQVIIYCIFPLANPVSCSICRDCLLLLLLATGKVNEHIAYLIACILNY